MRNLELALRASGELTEAERGDLHDRLYSITEGPISEGSKDPEDLIPRFARELDRVASNDCFPLKEEARGIDYKSDSPSYILCVLDDLTAQLEIEAAKVGLIFGSNEGDGACFGYWRPEEP